MWCLIRGIRGLGWRSGRECLWAGDEDENEGWISVYDSIPWMWIRIWIAYFVLGHYACHRLSSSKARAFLVDPGSRQCSKNKVAWRGVAFVVLC